ncbi:tyrosine-protein phosphatase [Ectobacillus antri]|uniref:tyrosine-protein phosphatase n=1 Tax=Ectobacillus antri TaxID=2486280 RepID=UPI000F595D20|nr:CpsB/CapC family capsule biosynthesis tyrosine phosphatase [Ectobacillus antri]
MIDMHCHILPGLDDGPQTLEESLAMVRLAEQQGIRTIVATPHHHNGRYINEKQTIITEVQQLNNILAQKNINVTIVPGQEVRLYGELLADYEANKIQTLNDTGKYILIEFPNNHVPRYTPQLLFEMQLKGLIPVIAHPERNAEIAEYPDKLYQFIKQGALAQLTAASIIGAFGKTIQKLSMQLVEGNLVHIVASDAHNTAGRACRISEAYHLIEEEFGTDMKYLFMDNAAYMVKGQMVDKIDPQPLRRKKLFGIF